MPEYRKPHQPGSVADSDMPAELEFSIETTTMRLKSLKLRRTEAAEKALEDHLRTQTPDSAPPPPPRDSRPAGRVRHDERGMAVWDWAAASGETAALSATNVMRKLEVSELSIEQTQRSLKAMQPPTGAGAGGGSDPYNQHRNQMNTNPLKRATSEGDPYNRVSTPKSAPMQRPVPKAPAPAAPAKKPGGSVLDQLLGRKK